MSARGRRRGHSHAGGHNDERWLLTYSDLITLLMALFIIMWAISTVNDGKFHQLAKSLSEAFSGKIMQGNRSIVEGSSGVKAEIVPTSPTTQTAQQSFDRTLRVTAANVGDLENLKRLQKEVDAYADRNGLSGKLKTSIDERGLVIRILPDDLLFDTGKADLKPGARGILDHLSDILRGLSTPNPIRIEGNTDNVPISTAQFANNWALSAARAVTVLSVLLDDGINPKRLSAAGYADQRPVATNTTAAGRSQNRRVEIVVVRRELAAAEGLSQVVPSGPGNGAANGSAGGNGPAGTGGSSGSPNVIPSIADQVVTP
jgi:chemotaxis protein MotB